MGRGTEKGGKRGGTLYKSQALPIAVSFPKCAVSLTRKLRVKPLYVRGSRRHRTKLCFLEMKHRLILDIHIQCVCVGSKLHVLCIRLHF